MKFNVPFGLATAIILAPAALAQDPVRQHSLATFRMRKRCPADALNRYGSLRFRMVLFLPTRLRLPLPPRAAQSAVLSPPVFTLLPPLALRCQVVVLATEDIPLLVHIPP